MVDCNSYDPDKVFKRFQLLAFPKSFVELWTKQDLDVQVDLTNSAYVKTLCGRRLLKFDDARAVSAPHRSFNIKLINNTTLQITFLPKNECISKAKLDKMTDKKFVIDLRLIGVSGVRCCGNELHAEIGRYYVSGSYEFCIMSHYPNVIDFGDVIINNKVVKYVRLKNESYLAAKVQYVKVVGFDVTPSQFIIQPKSIIRLSVSVKPTCLKAPNILRFEVRNPHDKFYNNETEDQNYINYTIKTRSNIYNNRIPKTAVVESLHKLHEPNPAYTYIDEELIIYKKRQAIAHKYLNYCKISPAKPRLMGSYTTGRDKCYDDSSIMLNERNNIFSLHDKITTYDLMDILFIPFVLDFGNVATSTHAKKQVLIKNNTKHKVTIKFFKDETIVYTDKLLSILIVKLDPLSEKSITVFCLGLPEGKYEKTFEYVIDNCYTRKHPYMLQVSNVRLILSENNLKFGMINNEGFVTSVPVRIYNNFNMNVDFKWNNLNSDTPFEIKPNFGTVPKHSCKICDITHLSKLTKTKTYEVDFVSESAITRIVPVELNIITRKLSIKFLRPVVIFKDIPLNLRIIEKVKMENSSREIAFFQVLEPLIPGITIEPMSGAIKPKMILNFNIIVQIPCVLEFSFDIYVKINNKENLILPISGNVLDPKINVNPKHVYMARIPSKMITYVPVTFQNVGHVRTMVEIYDTGDENIFNAYIGLGNDKERIHQFDINGGQSKTIYIKVYDVHRREYDMFVPFKINGLLGPPTNDSGTTEFNHFIRPYEQGYENNPKVKLKTVNKEIGYCRMVGVITGPWIEFSTENFEFDYSPNKNNIIEFTMTNISKYYLHITILISKLMPNFSLKLLSDEKELNVNDMTIKFEQEQGTTSGFSLKFHPKGHGKFVTTAILFLDKNMSLPYYNLNFIGRRQMPAMTPSEYRVIFPPCSIGSIPKKKITIDLQCSSNLEAFSCVSKEESNLLVQFIDHELINEDEIIHTRVTTELSISSSSPYTGNLLLFFSHETGACCDVEVHFCVTDCQLTLHANKFMESEDNPYPYYPPNSETKLYKYYETCTSFLEKWMFQQGFRRDLFPDIPETFHAISSALTTQSGSKSKGINVSYLNFIRRIAGPLMKHIKKLPIHSCDDSFKPVKEIHDTYKDVLSLLRTRGANLLGLQAKFLLSFTQFQTYSENVTPKCNADIILTKELLADNHLFNRLNKQSWIDFILQTYKVFVMDTCFFECVCINTQSRDVIKVLVDWYNEHTLKQHLKLRGPNKPVKVINNITTDLSDGIALASVIMSYCPYLCDSFSIFCEVQENSKDGDIVNNACLIIEAMNVLKLNFPLTSKDFLKPNFIQTLFLSIHLCVTLPMLQPKETIHFIPPLLKSSSRQLSISPSNQESLSYTFIIFNNNRNSFLVEKSSSVENGKKIILNVKYFSNFVDEETAILLICGINKTRIFDTYVVFLLHGKVGVLNPFRKCKVMGSLYRPSRVDVLISSPFQVSATFKLYITDSEPTNPMIFDDINKPKFYIRRLNLIDKEISLSGNPKDVGPDSVEHKLYLQLICLSTQVENTWVWFLSEFGHFFIKVTSHPRWDIAIDSLQAKVKSWPLDRCSCEDDCECYRMTVLIIPHRNELMLKALRNALLEHASDTMMAVFDRLIDSTTGKVILSMLLEEGGTKMNDLRHILRSETTFRVSSRGLLPEKDRVTLAQHTDSFVTLPVTILADNNYDKCILVLTSECGMDIRNYKIFFVESERSS